ncbi:hypothetical protein KFQ04_17060 [Pseudomonas synxantha]|nr:hypothetical protein KFQ04_17060 [Pseudomonas synxantha]
MAVHDLIQTACAVIAIVLALYGLEAERRTQLRNALRAVSSTVMIGAFYIVLAALIYMSVQEVVQFARSKAPMTRIEIVDLVINSLSICGFVWAGFFLFANLGRGPKTLNKKPAISRFHVLFFSVAPIEDGYFLQVDFTGSKRVLMP